MLNKSADQEQGYFLFSSVAAKRYEVIKIVSRGWSSGVICLSFLLKTHFFSYFHAGNEFNGQP
jgi:hypothetical protein